MQHCLQRSTRLWLSLTAGPGLHPASRLGLQAELHYCPTLWSPQCSPRSLYPKHTERPQLHTPPFSSTLPPLPISTATLFFKKATSAHEPCILTPGRWSKPSKATTLCTCCRQPMPPRVRGPIHSSVNHVPGTIWISQGPPWRGEGARSGAPGPAPVSEHLNEPSSWADPPFPLPPGEEALDK